MNNTRKIIWALQYLMDLSSSSRGWSDGHMRAKNRRILNQRIERHQDNYVIFEPSDYPSSASETWHCTWSMYLEHLEAQPPLKSTSTLSCKKWACWLTVYSIFSAYIPCAEKRRSFAFIVLIIFFLSHQNPVRSEYPSLSSLMLSFWIKQSQ